LYSFTLLLGKFDLYEELPPEFSLFEVETMLFICRNVERVQGVSQCLFDVNDI